MYYRCDKRRQDRRAEPIAGPGGLDRQELGIPSGGAYAAGCCQPEGIDGIPGWNVCLVFGGVRFAAILQGVKSRAREGNASSEKAVQLGEMVVPPARMSIEMS